MISTGDKRKNQSKMCDDCQNLVGKPRYTDPHRNLVCTGGNKVSSIMGAADETFYSCKVCGHEWLYETGSCGMGWIV